MRKIPALLLALCACAGCARSFPAVEDLPVRAEMPDPLVMLDGRKVTSARMWRRERRPELKALFEHYMYGRFPPVPRVRGKLVRSDPGLFGGKATLKEISLELGDPSVSPIDLLLVVPNRRGGPAPVFLGLNFTGNHSLLDDPRVALPRGWMHGGVDVKDHRAAEEGRGKNAGTWAIEQSIDHGWAVATFYYWDVFPDRPDFAASELPYSLRSWTPPPGDGGGAIAAWAWGLHRAVDYLVTDKDLDPRRIAVTGHSRLGKAALLAAAFDERLGLCIAHQAGCGGSAPSRTKNPKGETVKAINQGFPHWFNDVFPRFNEQVERLPFDQNCLAALVAPRPLLFTNGIEDQWADPPGQFEVLRSAEPVYVLLGGGPLLATEPPPLGQLLPLRLSYYVRAGGHVSDPDYWKVFRTFAGNHLRGSSWVQYP